tara:strand:- start:1384 stop:2178 length:795 start_codon:yes stop_codon:yes gene_type:complete
MITEPERVKLTISCDDCSYIPKVHNAGLVSDEKYQIMHNGIKIIKGAYHGDWMTKIIEELKGHHEPQEEKAFYEVLKRLPKRATMIELGSNWSYYSMWFQKAINTPTNIMIEPHKGKLEVGRKHFEINGLRGTFKQASIGKNTSPAPPSPEFETTSLAQLCIDDIIKDHQLDSVDIIHADIQCSELDMLHGAIESITKKKIKYFFISTHGPGAHLHTACLNFLRSKQFTILCEHSMAESYSADGLIVAAQDDLNLIPISKRGSN